MLTLSAYSYSNGLLRRHFSGDLSGQAIRQRDSLKRCCSMFSLAEEGVFCKSLVREGGLEPPRPEPLEPKSRNTPFLINVLHHNLLKKLRFHTRPYPLKHRQTQSQWSEIGARNQIPWNPISPPLTPMNRPEPARFG